jgi:hypothetical protein
MSFKKFSEYLYNRQFENIYNNLEKNAQRAANYERKAAERAEQLKNKYGLDPDRVDQANKIQGQKILGGGGRFNPWTAFQVQFGIQTVAQGFQELFQPIDQLVTKFQELGNQLVNFGKRQLKAFEDYEVDRLTSINDIVNNLTPSKYDRTPILSFGQGEQLFDQLQPQIIKMANELPGSNKDYSMMARMMADVAAQGAKGDVGKFGRDWLDITKIATLSAVTVGKQPNVANTAINQFLTTGKVSQASALSKANPTFVGALRDPRLGSVANFDDRVAKLIAVGNKIFSPDILARYSKTFSARMANFMEMISGETGVFSMIRKIEPLKKSLGEKISDWFDMLSPDLNKLKPFIDKLLVRGVAVVDEVLKSSGIKARLEGIFNRLSALPENNITSKSVAGAIFNVPESEAQNAVRGFLGMLNGWVKSFGDALRGNASDPIVKELISSVLVAWKEIEWQKLNFAVQNWDIVLLSNPLGALQALFSVIVGLSLIAGNIAGIASVLTFVGGVIGTVAAVIVGIPAGILGAIAILVGGVVALGVWFLASPESFKRGLDGLVKTIVGWWQNLMDTLSNVFKPIASWVKGKWNDAVQAAPKIKGQEVQPQHEGAGGFDVVGFNPTSLNSSSSKTFGGTVTHRIEVNDKAGTLNAATGRELMDTIAAAITAEYGGYFQSPEVQA